MVNNYLFNDIYKSKGFLTKIEYIFSCDLISSNIQYTVIQFNHKPLSSLV